MNNRAMMGKALDFLQDFQTPEDFRAYCQGNGITGTPMRPYACLVAVALERLLGIGGAYGDISVADDLVSIRTACGETPEPIAKAIAAFDAGLWPELVA